MTNHRVLIVDDDEFIRTFLRNSLLTQGYEIFEAENGRVGLELFRQIQPSVIISDIKMPEMNGEEFVSALGLKPDSDFAVIIMTGMSSDEAIRTFYQLGVSAFLPKPLNLHQLRGLVKHLDELVNVKIELKRYQKELERMVDQRTEALQKTMAEIRKVSLAKDNFLAKMSHEIRTPLNAILGLVEIIEDRALKKKCLTCTNEFKDIKASASFLAALIGDVLDMSKIASGTMQLAESPADLFALIDDCLVPFKQQVASKDLYLNLDISPDCPRYVWCDSTKIRQAILNLIGNAVKFTAQGGITVSVSPACDYELPQCLEGRFPLCIKVVDTGPGISPEDQERIFKPFEQTGNAGEIGLGSGLGLSIVKDIAKLMGGDVVLASEAGNGSVFSVFICLKKADKADFIALNRKIESVNISHGRALIVDDVAINRTVAAFQLQQHGWRVAEVDSGEACLELLKNDRGFDLILMDISMPGMGGLECAARIKADTDLHALPVIALTALAVDGDRQKILDAGMDGYVAKPISSDKLWQEVARVLDERGRAVLSDEKRPEPDTQVIAQEVLSEPAPLDIKRLTDEVCQGSKELVQEILKTLLQSLPQWLAEASDAVDARDGDRIRKVCHLIRGTASTITAYPLYDAAVLLGNLVKSERMDEDETASGLAQLRKAGAALENQANDLLSTY